MALGAPDIVESRHGCVDVLRHAVKPAHFVEHARRSALLAGAVVRQDDHQGVVQAIHFFQEGEQPPNLRVGVVELRGEGLLKAGGEQPLIFRKLGPRPDARVSGRKHRVRRDQAHGLLA